MDAEAIVVERGAGWVRLQGERRAACGGCAGEQACGALAPRRPVCFEADDPIGAPPGARVRVEMPDRALLAAAWAAYGLPVVGLLLGGASGAALGVPDAGIAVMGAIGAVLGWRHGRSVRLPRPRVVEILTTEDHA